MKHSPADLAEMSAAIGGTLIAARQWLEAGFSPGDAAAYTRAGCFDVDRTIELRRAGLTPSHIARLGLAWDYCAGKVELAELQERPKLEAVELLWEVTSDDESQEPAQPTPRWRRSKAVEPTLQQRKII